MLLERTKPVDAPEFRALTWPVGPALDDFVRVVREQSFAIPQASLDSTGWRLEGSAKRDLLAKLRAGGTPLGEYCKGRFYRGVLTGLNDAFVVDRATRDQLIAEHPSSAAVLKPFLRGRDVKRWKVESQDLWLIFTRRGIDIDKHPAIKKHLLQFKDRLMPGIEGGRKAGSYKWFEIQDNIAYWPEFETPKIVYPDIAFHCHFAADSEGLFPDCTLFLIPEAPLHFLPILNSKVHKYFIDQICPAIRGGYKRFKSIYIGQLPIPPIKAQQTAELTSLTKQLIKLKSENAPASQMAALEADLDERVAHLFWLTPAEIALLGEAG